MIVIDDDDVIDRIRIIIFLGKKKQIFAFITFKQ